MRPLFVGCALLVGIAATPVSAFTVTQAGLFCNSKSVAQKLAKTFAKKGPERLRWAFHIQRGIARLHGTKDPWTGIVLNPQSCEVGEVTETADVRIIDQGSVVQFTPTNTTPMPASFGERSAIMHTRWHVKGTEWLYVVETMRHAAMIASEQ